MGSSVTEEPDPSLTWVLCDGGPGAQTEVARDSPQRPPAAPTSSAGGGHQGAADPWSEHLIDAPELLHRHSGNQLGWLQQDERPDEALRRPAGVAATRAVFNKQHVTRAEGTGLAGCRHLDRAGQPNDQLTSVLRLVRVAASCRTATKQHR
jgi:hypothetical protein